MAEMTWQPIETAPKDGTPVLAVCGQNIEKIVWSKGWASGIVTKANGPCWGICHGKGHVILDEGWDEGTGCYLTPDIEPTHWMPLPLHPRTSQNGSEIYDRELDHALRVVA